MNKSIRDAIERELKAARDIADRAESEGRDLTSEDRAEVTARLKTAGDLKKRATDQDELRKQLDDLGDGIGVPDDGSSGGRPDGYHTRRGSLGQAFVESDEYQALLASVPGGRFGEKAHVQSQPYGVKGLITGVSETSAGSLVDPQRLGLLDPFYPRPLTVRQLVTPGQTETDTIEYVKLVTVTNAAAPVAEATGSGVIGDGTGGTITAAAGGLKPESNMVFEKATTNVKTVAHWIPATKRALSDASQMRTLIDSFLEYGLEEELEDQILLGNGVGENFLGVNATSGIQTQAAPGVGQTILDTARMARRKVSIGGRSVATAFVMNPIDWETIELMKDTQGRYHGMGPFAMMTPTLWGLPVVESEAVAAGTAWCADWRKAVLWDREQGSIQITDSHADFFIRNLVALLAELRAAFAVLRPAAFVKITLA